MAEKLNFDLLLGRNTLASGLDDSTKRARTLESTLVTAAGVFAGNLATKGFELLGDAVAGTTQFLKDSIAASVQKENALNSLSSALRRTGEFSNQTVQEFDDFSDALERASVFSGDVVLSQLALAKSLGLTNTEAKDLVSAAANLSAVLDQDLETSVRQLTSTYSGQAGQLARLLPELKQFTQAQLQSGEAVRFVSSQFGGAASAQVQTYAGSITQAENAFGKILEEIGNFITKSPAVISIVNTAGQAFEGLATSLAAARTALGIGLTPIQEQRKALLELKNQLDTTNDAIRQRQQFLSQAQSQGNEQRAAVFQAQINDLEQKRNEIIAQRVAIRGGIRQDQEVAAEADRTRRIVEEDQKFLDSRRQLNEQLAILEADRTIREQEAILANNALTDEQRAIEVQRLAEFEQLKIDTILQFELEKAALLDDAKSREIAAEVAQSKALKAEADLRLRDIRAAAQAEIALEQKKNAEKLAIAGGFANLITAVAAEGSREAFLAQKAVAAAQIVVQGLTAEAAALAPPPLGLGPVAGVGLASLVRAKTAIGLATVAAQTIKGFQDGGFIGGIGGATIGRDTTTVNAREGELVLNADQQRRLLERLESGGGSQPLVIQIDGREIARTVRDQREMGFAV